MRADAAPVLVLGDVAVPAHHLQVIREAELLDGSIPSARFCKSAGIASAVLIFVINGEEVGVRFAAAHALTAIVIDNFEPEFLPLPFCISTSLGAMLWRS